MNSCFGIILTLIVWALLVPFKNVKFLNKIPSMLLAGGLIIVILKLFSLDFITYNKSASFITMLLGPATICLAYPLYKNFDELKKNKRALYFGLIVATFVAIISTIITGKLLHADLSVILSMIPKSVTTPIAVEISKNIGAIPELTACIVIFTGIVGALFGHYILHLLKIKSDVSIGLSMGASSHVLGTSSCYEKNRAKQVSVSTIALIAVGFLTTVLAPLLIRFLH